MKETSIRRDGKDGRNIRPAAARPSTSGGPGVAGQQTAQVQQQFKSFEEAMRLFHARKLKEAKEAFGRARSGPNREIAHKAELHIRMCDQRLESQKVELKSVDDRYNYAIALINTRDLAEARKHLEAALEQDPRADYLYYAMALCCGLSGDLNGAYENLKVAIELQPRNRIAARQDADFAGISNQPPLDRLLHPEKPNSF